MDINFAPSVGSVSGRSRGTATPAANGILTSFAIPHGLGVAPTFIAVTAGNLLSSALHYATADATNITVTFVAAPLAGALAFRWVAEV